MNSSYVPEPKSPFVRLIGLRFLACADGRSVCCLEATPALFNPNGVMHGAAIYALADTGMGAAVASLLAAGEQCATVEIKISYLRPVRQGLLRCEAQMLQKGRRVAFLTAAIYLEDKLVAHATGTFAVTANAPGDDSERRSGQVPDVGT